MEKKLNVVLAITSSYDTQKEMTAKINEQRDPVVALYESQNKSLSEMVQDVAEQFKGYPKVEKKFVPFGSLYFRKKDHEHVATFIASEEFKALNAFKSWASKRYHKETLILKGEAAVDLTEKELKGCTKMEILDKASARGIEHAATVNDTKADIILEVLAGQKTAPSPKPPSKHQRVSNNLKSALQSLSKDKTDGMGAVRAYIQQAIEALDIIKK